MTRRTLFVHIGTHKTGTTSFQSALAERYYRLRARGTHVYMDDLRGQRVVNAVPTAHSVFRPSLRTPSRRAGVVGRGGVFVRARVMARMHRFLADDDAARFVVSAEAFCFARDDAERDRVRRLFERPGIEIVPLLCLREPAGWRRSWTAHLDRFEPKFRGSPGRGRDDIRGDWYYDTEAIRDFWSAVGDLRVIDYDAEVAARGDVVPALFEAIGEGASAPSDGLFLNRGSD